MISERAQVLEHLPEPPLWSDTMAVKLLVVRDTVDAIVVLLRANSLWAQTSREIEVFVRGFVAGQGLRVNADLVLGGVLTDLREREAS